MIRLALVILGAFLKLLGKAVKARSDDPIDDS